MSISLSVAILSFGRDELFRAVLAALADAGVPGDRILVVHNPYGPQDGWTPAAPPGVAVRRMPDNVGYGPAMNAAIDALSERSDAVLLLTHDTGLEPGAVARLTAALEASPAYGVLGPAVELRGHMMTLTFGGTVSGGGVLGHRTVAPAVDATGVADAEWLDGCALLVRTKAIRDVGGIHAGYFMYFEEPELCDRMRAAGWRVGVVPAARAHSEPGMSSRPAVFAYLYARNGLRWARAQRGRRFAARFAARQLAASWQELPKPGGLRFRRRETRRHGVALAGGRCAGLAAAVLGLSGPPPRLLMRTGDLRAADP